MGEKRVKIVFHVSAPETTVGWRLSGEDGMFRFGCFEFEVVVERLDEDFQ